MAPRGASLQARVLERLAQKNATAGRVASLADPPLPPRPPSKSATSSRPPQRTTGHGARDRHGAQQLSDDDDWPQSDGDASDSPVSLASSSDDGADDWRPRPQSGQTVRERGLGGDASGGRGKLEEQVLARLAGRGTAARGRRQKPDYDCEAAEKQAPGGRKHNREYAAALGGGIVGAFFTGKLFSRKELARCVRRRRRTIKTTLAAALGLYVTGLFLAMESADEQLRVDMPRGQGGLPPEELHEAPPTPREREAQLKEMRETLPREAWLAAGLGPPPATMPPPKRGGKGGAHPDGLRQRARQASGG
mmetsp:Transcript_3409/g.9771  ORF Transcript_3409/g.9771 Transcript_3409/m.9771 type:complete len:307 (-) Transcript_3409:17-937(-)